MNNEALLKQMTKNQTLIIEKLQEENQVLQEDLAAMEQQTESLQSKLRLEYQSEINDIQQKYAQSVMQNQLLQAKYDKKSKQSKEQIAEVKQQYKFLSQKNQDYQKEILDLNRKSELTKVEFNKMMENFAQVNEQVKQLKGSLEIQGVDYGNKVEELNILIQDKDDEISSLIQANTELNENNEKIQFEYETLQKQIGDQNSQENKKTSNLQLQIESLTHEYDNLLVKYNEQTQEKQKCIQQLNQIFENQFLEYQQQNQEKESEILNLKQENNGLKQDLLTSEQLLQLESTKLKDSLIEQENLKQYFTSSIQLLEKENDNLISQQKTIEAQLEEQITKLKEAQLKFTDVEKQRLQDQIFMSEKVQQIETLQLLNKQLIQEQDQFRVTIFEKEEKFNSILKDQEKSLKDKLEDNKKEIERIQCLHEQLRKENNALILSNKMLEQGNIEVNKQKQHLETCLQSWFTKFSSLIENPNLTNTATLQQCLEQQIKDLQQQNILEKEQFNQNVLKLEQVNNLRINQLQQETETKYKQMLLQNENKVKELENIIRTMEHAKKIQDEKAAQQQLILNDQIDTLKEKIDSQNAQPIELFASKFQECDQQQQLYQFLLAFDHCQESLKQQLFPVIVIQEQKIVKLFNNLKIAIQRTLKIVEQREKKISEAKQDIDNHKKEIIVLQESYQLTQDENQKELINLKSVNDQLQALILTQQQSHDFQLQNLQQQLIAEKLSLENLQKSQFSQKKQTKTSSIQTDDVQVVKQKDVQQQLLDMISNNTFLSEENLSLQNQHHDTEQQNLLLSERINRLQKEINSLKESINQLQQQNKSEVKQNLALMQQIDPLQRQIDNLTRENRKLTSVVSDYEKQHGKLSVSASPSPRKYQLYGSLSRIDSQGSIQLKKSIEDDLEQEKARHAEVVQKLNDQINNLNSQFYSEKQKNQELQNKIHDLEKKTQQGKYVIEQINEEQLFETKQDYQSFLEQKNEELKLQYHKIKQRFDIQEEKFEQLKVQIYQIQQEKEQLIIENHSLKLDDVEVKLKQELQIMNQNQQIAIAEYKHNIQLFENQIKEQNLLIQALQIEMNNQKIFIDDLQNTNSQLQIDYEILKNQYNDSEQNNNDYNQQVSYYIIQIMGSCATKNSENEVTIPTNPHLLRYYQV